MSDFAIFAFGTLVTIICSAAMGLLIWGAHLDGLRNRSKEVPSP
jgi:hypothetical protein